MSPLAFSCCGAASSGPSSSPHCAQRYTIAPPPPNPHTHALTHAPQVTLKLPKAPPCFMDVLSLRNAAIGWGAPPAGGFDQPGAPQPLLANLELVIKKKQRVLVLGPNGGWGGAGAGWMGGLGLG